MPDNPKGIDLIFGPPEKIFRIPHGWCLKMPKNDWLKAFDRVGNEYRVEKTDTVVNFYPVLKNAEGEEVGIDTDHPFRFTR